MSRSDTVTKLPLATWANLMGLNPLHFEGVQMAAVQQRTCDHAWLQHPWQGSDALSRDDIAQAIALAEEQIEREVGFRLVPSWEVDEWQPVAQPYQSDQVRFGRTGARGYPQTATARWKHFIAGGIRAVTNISLGAAIVWTDSDADGYKETGTVGPIATTATDSCEMLCYYPGHAGDEAWRIRPIHATILGGNVTITFRRELVVIEAIMEQVVSAGADVADGATDADFLGTVDVCRMYNDSQQQVHFLWEPTGDPCGCDDGTTCALCAFETQTGCLISSGDPSYANVSFHPADWNATILVFDTTDWAVGRQPDELRLWYLAGLRDRGLPCPGQTMAPFWQQVVARMASAILERPPCNCRSAAFERWQKDLAFSGGAEELATYQLAKTDLDNPFGTRAGQVWAWHQIQRSDSRVGQGVVVA